MTAVQHVDSGDGTPISFRVSGSGEPLLLVHGSATSGADWIAARPFLGERFDGLEGLRAAFPDSRRELIPGQLHVAHVFAARYFADLVARFCGESPSAP
jgi:hypothetical protein